MKAGETDRLKSTQQISWVWISGIAFLLCIAASSVLIFFGKQLDALGITGNIYYIILIPLGFSSAAFLAGAMKSYASFKSNETFPYGQLNLSGPIVIFALVVGGGFIMPNLNKKTQFDLKMRVIRRDNPSELLNEGSVILYVGKNPINVKIHDGEVTFHDIPAAFNNKKIKVTPIITNYQLAGPDSVLISKNEDYVDVNIVRTKQSLNTELRGSITNEKNAPVKHAFLNFGSGLATCYTNDNGDFVLNVPLPSGEQVPLKILVNGVILFNEGVTISASTPINLKLSLKP